MEVFTSNNSYIPQHPIITSDTSSSNDGNNNGDVIVEPNIDPLEDDASASRDDDIQCQPSAHLHDRVMDGNNINDDRNVDNLSHHSSRRDKLQENCNDEMSPMPHSSPVDDVHDDEQHKMLTGLDEHRHYNNDSNNLLHSPEHLHENNKDDSQNIIENGNSMTKSPISNSHEQNNSPNHNTSQAPVSSLSIHENASHHSKSSLSHDPLSLQSSLNESHAHASHQHPLQLTANSNEHPSLDLSGNMHPMASSSVSPSEMLNKSDNCNANNYSSHNAVMDLHSEQIENNNHNSNGTSDLQQHSHLRSNSIYDYDRSNKTVPMMSMDSNPPLLPSHHLSHLGQQDNRLQENQLKDNAGLHSLNPCDNLDFNKRDSLVSSLNSNSSIQDPSQQALMTSNSINSSLNSIPSNDLNQSYDSSVSGSSSEFPSTATCYDPVLIRRGRGRPRGSKNGTGMGRGRESFSSRGAYRFNVPDDRTCTAYDLRHISDPFGTARRGRPRSRFIVDLGEQNHEAWTKARMELNVSDAELTTLLLSLLESRQELEDSRDSDTMLGLIGSEYKKWKEKFASQVSMLSHFASIHNSNCSTCLGINFVSRKKKLTPIGTGKRGRPRKYPPPVGYGPGMQRPDTIDEDGNIFEPQCILKDGTIVKAEPHDDKNKIHNGEQESSSSSGSSSSNSGGLTSPLGQLPPRAMLTHEEMQKRREYYSNHKNKIKYVCHYCQVHFYHKPNFDFHIRKLEREGKCRIYDKVNNLYLCESCGEGFSWREKLEKHLRLAEQHGTHNQKELLVYGDFQCNMCGKTFNKRNTYLQHVKWHEDREDVPCVICATLFKQTELRRHLMEVHNNDSLPCCYCGKLFTSRKYLEKHELVHQAGNFPCPECGKCFSQKVTMQHHLRSHSLDKEYSCESCGQVFTQRMGLCLHLRKQFGIAEFSQECEICTVYFCNTYDLEMHKRKVHNMTTEQLNEELPPESYLPLSMRSHHMQQEHSQQQQDHPHSHQHEDEDDEDEDDDRSKVYNDANAVVKNMLEATLGSTLNSSVNMSMKHEGDHMNAHSSLRDETMADFAMRSNQMRDNLMRSNLMREEVMRNETMRSNSVDDSSMRGSGSSSLRDELMRDEEMRDDTMRQSVMRESLMRDTLFRDNSLRELALRENQMREDVVMRENPMRDNALLMNEHMRHMVERRELDTDDPLRLNPALHSMQQQQQQQQQQDEQLHMPQDLTRMTAESHMVERSMSQHMAPDSPARDTPGNPMTDQLGRMAVENFGRMTATPGGYLAEHLRRMAENQSRNSSSADTTMTGHYDDRDYSRLDNLRSMSRGSPADTMPRLGENLSHMGVIRPSQTPSSTPQWPPHMQNHPGLEGMNQSHQSSQHALYPLPFWPYDPSLRHYNH